MDNKRYREDKTLLLSILTSFVSGSVKYLQKSKDLTTEDTLNFMIYSFTRLKSLLSERGRQLFEELEKNVDDLYEEIGFFKSKDDLTINDIMENLGWSKKE